MPFAAATILVACSADNPEPPMLTKIPERLEIHGDVRIDNYFWLNERDNPDVIDYLEAENAYLESAMSPYEGLQNTLFDEMKSRIKQDEQSVPYRDGDYFYYYRYEEGREYPIYCRKKGSLDADEEVLLDVNIGAEGHEFYSVRGFAVSTDHSNLAFSRPRDGQAAAAQNRKRYGRCGVGERQQDHSVHEAGS
jgi:oligopeptidase B